ncbi:efflux RND transporter periplasmic adaptor subunit [Mariniflexile sp. AS56]|uniref:efflux RND transporter periplasmic adaptor subunit n=1 Tax=Mariniflexile sp. AS56 TaxID=3063957 RepID=UPI0026E93AD4|nr:efflux RND transporter periplasmic adaptor subunit [Mariniflexile sp. AS56]MDO7171126.1 efflux RND transporter periplasmic adaptor subunit [Mariniflexile sp. AS56]
MNTKIKNILKMVGILFIGLLLGWMVFGGSETPKEEHDHSEVEGAETIWTCSMHPQIQMKEPGQCPLCGMDLIPLEANESAMDPNAFQMTEDAMKLANIQTMVVGSKDANKKLALNGKVQIDERKLYTQSSHISGRIEKLNVNFTGEKVSRGQTLAMVYSPELVTAQEELLQANRIKESQPELFEAAKQKLSNWKIGATTINKIISNNKPIQQFPITADVSGIITAKKVDLGNYVGQGMPIYEIADLSSLWVLFDVYETDMSWVKVGNKINYTVQSLPGETFEGAVSFIDPLINPQTRVASARVEVKNSENKLKPEMFVSGVVSNNLSTSTSKDIVIPKTAVMWTGERSVVYVKSMTANKVSFKLREVLLGASLGDAYLIKEGLLEDDEIVVRGTFTVDAASQLAGKPSMMNPGSEAMSSSNETETSKKKETKSISVNQKAKDALKPVISEYMSLSDALVNDDLAAAKKAGNKLLKAVEGVNMGLFTGESHTVWMDLSGNLKKGLEHVNHFSSLDDFRKSLGQISDAVINLEITFKPNKGTLYVMHCPMANSNKGGDWLSTSKEVKNPYYGQAMLTCGEVSKELKE